MVAISRLLQLADKVLFLLIETLVQTFSLLKTLVSFFLHSQFLKSFIFFIERDIYIL